MRDGQFEKFGVGKDPWAAAMGAASARRGCVENGQTITAEAGHDGAEFSRRLDQMK